MVTGGVWARTRSVLDWGLLVLRLLRRSLWQRQRPSTDVSIRSSTSRRTLHLIMRVIRVWRK